MYLNCHTYYSLRYGTLSPARLVEEAARLGIDSLALTDINNTTGTIDFVSECRKHGIKSIGGIEFRNEEHRLLYTTISVNNAGFREINDFLTWHNMNKTPLPPCPPVFNHVVVVYPFANNLPRKLKEQEYIGVQPHELHRLVSSDAVKNKEKLLAFHPVSFTGTHEYQLHQYLRAIDKNTLLTKLSPSDLARQNEQFLPPDLFCIAYEDFPIILKNTKKIIEMCGIDFDFDSVKNKKLF